MVIDASRYTLLDSVGPLTFILEQAVEATETALSLTANASMAFNQERRKKAISEMNAELVEMATEDDTFLDAVPEELRS